jgi:hypothetical protein
VTFPHTPRDLDVELFIDGAWLNITNDVMVRDSIPIARGRSDESGTSSPSTLSLSLNNRAGKYSPRNPLGVFYGKIARNTRIRVSVNGGGRFIGEVASWPGQWDISAKDAWVPIEAAGILRRIGQGNQSVSSALKSFYLTTSPLTYWPLDDGGGSDRGWPAAGTYTGSTIHRQYGKAVSSFGDGILANYLSSGVRINDTVPSGQLDELRGYCHSSDPTPPAMVLDFVYRTDPAISGNGTAMAEWSVMLNMLGTADKTREIWAIGFQPDGVNDDIELRHAVDNVDPDVAPIVTNLANSAALDAITDGLLHHVRLELVQDGTGVDYAVYVDGVSVLSGTKATTTLRNNCRVVINYDRDTANDLMAMGHVCVWDDTANVPDVATTSSLAHGFTGEAAGRRFERLCEEVGVPFTGTGDLDDTIAMGPQYEDTFSSQLAEIEETDRGLIYEPRSTFSLGYITRTSRYNLTTTATINFDLLQLAPPFEPVEDDQSVRNDVFAQRREGSSFRATLETGALSVQDPPDGVGRYKDEVGLNPETNEMLEGLANWLLNLGTVDEARYPRITVDLATASIASNPTLSAALLAVDVGSRITITDAARLFIYDDIDLLVLGYSENINVFEHTITFNCAPYSPYVVAEYGSAVGTGPRYDTAGSELGSGVTATATSLSVAASATAVDGAVTLWTTTAGEFPFDIFVGGERMRVTNISGASSPQTFTVVRSVNGVVKTHASGTAVRLWDTPRYGL